jgi:hypothetical protein
MTRLDAIQYLFDNANPETPEQKIALLEAIQDVMYASEGAFEMETADVEHWLNDSLELVKTGVFDH